MTFKVSTDVKVYSKQEGTYQCVGGAQGSRFRVASQEADLSIAKLEDFTGKAMKSSPPPLDHFVVQNSEDFLS